MKLHCYTALESVSPDTWPAIPAQTSRLENCQDSSGSSPGSCAQEGARHCQDQILDQSRTRHGLMFGTDVSLENTPVHLVVSRVRRLPL